MYALLFAEQSALLVCSGSHNHLCNYNNNWSPILKMSLASYLAIASMSYVLYGTEFRWGKTLANRSFHGFDV